MDDDETKIERVKSSDVVKAENVPDPREILKPTKGDAIHTGIQGTLASIPMAGGALSTIFSFGAKSPLTVRRDNFIISLDDRIKKLEKDGKVSSKYLLLDDNFLDVAAQALPIAIQNSSPEKINALRNAIINTALQIEIDKDSKFIYLNFINELTQTQIMILKIFINPGEYIEELFQHGEKNYQDLVVVNVVKDLQKLLKIDKTIYDISLKRLETDGLIDLTDKSPGMPIGGYDKNSWIIGKAELEKRTKNLITPFGIMFDQFISEHPSSAGEDKFVK